MTQSSNSYRGRFAPSPTGALHFGSLVAAVGSYLDARSQGGEWLIRIEDLDPPREVPGAADDILRTLEAFGFEWDGPVLYQSQRLEAYGDAVTDLLHQHLAYPCGCSRKEIAIKGRTGAEGPIYPGLCRTGLAAGKEPRSLRLRTYPEPVIFKDRIQGQIQQSVEAEIGDFIIRRADGLYAYQLAVVVDDGWQDINQVVRGCDLLISTPRQIQLQSLLGLPSVTYAHLPLAVDADGAKLSKQEKAHPVEAKHPVPALLAALEFLNQPLPAERTLDLESLWEWATLYWDITRIPQQQKRPLP